MENNQHKKEIILENLGIEGNGFKCRKEENKVKGKAQGKRRRNCGGNKPGRLKKIGP